MLSGSIFHALRAHSITYFHENEWLYRKGAYLQILLENESLVERGLITAFTVFKVRAYFGET